MKKPPTIKHLKRICTKCKHSQILWGNRYCRLIKANFNENGACLDFVQAPKKEEKYEQLSLFDEVLK